jgi:hypothetical protein
LSHDELANRCITEVGRAIVIAVEHKLPPGLGKQFSELLHVSIGIEGFIHAFGTSEAALVVGLGKRHHDVQ